MNGTTRSADQVVARQRADTDTDTVAPAPARYEESRLSTPWAAVLGVGWPVAMVIGMALEPTPAHPEMATPLIVEVGSYVLFAALVATAIAASYRHRSAATAGVVTGLVAVTFSITCPLSGHHGFGLWWVGQFAVITAMLGVSLAATVRRRSLPEPD